jgi:predicted nucleic acid-binding protein
VFPKPLTTAHVRGLVRDIVKSPGMHLLTAGPEHADVLDTLLAEQRELRGNIFHDLHIAALMREHGIRRIVTRDTDFHRFTFLEVVDPAAME